MQLVCIRLRSLILPSLLLLAMASAAASLAAQTPQQLTLQKISGDDQVIPFGQWRNFAVRVTDWQGRPVGGAKVAWQMPDIGTYTYVGATDGNGICTATNMYTFATPVTHTQIAILVDRDTPVGFTDISRVRTNSDPVKFTFRQGTPTSPQVSVSPEPRQALRHFRWTYSYGAPGQQQRDWVQKSPTKWVEIYPNGDESSFTLQQSAASVDGVNGVILSKDGAGMMVFVPNIGETQLNRYGDWLRFQSADDATHKWSFLGQISEVSAAQSSATNPLKPSRIDTQAQATISSPPVSPPTVASESQQSSEHDKHLDKGLELLNRNRYADALKEFRKSAEKGSGQAEGHIGDMYLKGLGVAKSIADAVAWFRKGADHGDAHSQYCMGEVYQFGIGVLNISANYGEALKWYRLAAEQGDAESQLVSGVFYGNGWGVQQDYAEALKWYRRAAQQGNLQAYTNIGVLYATGHGVARDFSQALIWYHKAADQGYAIAQGYIGNFYANGWGVEKDYSEAVNWYRKSAAQGVAEAQDNLGWCYENGFGVAKDYGEAVRWFTLAANQGLANAQNNLGWMYQNGFGVPKNDMQGIEWYKKALAQGDQRAATNIKGASAEVCAQTSDWQNAETACQYLIANGIDTPEVRKDLNLAQQSELAYRRSEFEQKLASNNEECQQTGNWQSAEAACKFLLDSGVDTPQIRRNLAAAAQNERAAKENQRQEHIADLQQQLHDKLSEAEQIERGSADTGAQAGNDSISQGVAGIYGVIAQRKAQNLRNEAEGIRRELEQLTGNSYDEDLRASEERTANYQPQPNLIQQSLNRQMSQLNQIGQQNAQRQAAQRQAAQQQTSSAPAPRQVSASGTSASPLPTSGWVDRILERVGSWSCPSSVSAQDGNPPQVNANACMRDQYVKAAVLHAWAAKCYAGAERDNTARKELKAMFDSLQAAQDMCSTHPIVTFGPVTPCDTERVYRCGELGGDAASYAQQLANAPSQNDPGDNSAQNSNSYSDPCRDKPEPCAAAAK
jgi:uncharacterized protein